MKNRTKKKSKIWLAAIEIILLCLLPAKSIYAAEEAETLEVFTGDLEVSVYVKGIESGSGLSVQIGTAACEDIEVTGIDEKEVPMRTLVMLDNSISIPEKARDRIAEVLQNLTADRLVGEEIAITVFSEDITWLTDYTSDYSTLRSAVEKISYQDQETYLTDVLYDLLLSGRIAGEDAVYNRIIVISDGVDNKSIGYTKEELYTFLRENPIPVYTLGVGTGKNNEQLENMFSISRITKAESFLLDELENTLDVNSILNEDRDILEIKIKPDAELLDGTRKSVKLDFGSGQSLTTEINMPQQENVDKPPKETEQPTPIKQPETGDTAKQSIQQEKQGIGLAVLLMIILAALMIGAGIIFLVIFFYKKKKKDKTFETITEDALSELVNAENTKYEKTEIVGMNRKNKDGDTFMIWDSDASYNIVLTDVDSPYKTFQVPIASSVVIGRKEGISDIVINYDRTVSGKHCRIDLKNGRFFIVDLQSANKTFVNNSEILSETELFSGDILKLGNVKLKFEVR